MSIRNKLLIIIIFAVLISISVIVFMLYKIEIVKSAFNEEQLVSGITQDISDLLILSEEYIIQPNNRVITQWEIKYAATHSKISGVTPYSTIEAGLIADLKSNIIKFKPLFEKLVAADEIPEKRLRNALIGRTLVEARIISSLSNNLIKLKRDRVEILQNDLNNWLLVFILLLAIVSTSVSYLILRGIVKPISRLKQNINFVSKGEFNRPVLISSNDEIGDLANAFDNMRKNLLATTISKNKLEEYVKERTHDLIQAKEQAELASKAKSEFLSSMSHELRTPLNSILGFAQILLSYQDSSLSNEQQDSINEILKSGYLLLDLINDVLDLSTIESGLLTPEINKVNVCQITNDCESLINAALAKQKNITINNLITDIDAFVYADKKYLKQVIINLLSNAIKYNSPHGLVTIKLSEPDHRDYLRIEVTDTGLGISENDIIHLFDPFERLSHKNGPIEGAGIGLHVAKQLITSMNGFIGVISSVNSGSTFWIELPTTEKPDFNV